MTRKSCPIVGELASSPMEGTPTGSLMTIPGILTMGGVGILTNVQGLHIDICVI